MPSSETIQAIGNEEFLTGLVFGFAALAIGALIVHAWDQWRDTPAPIVGALLTGAALAALHSIRDVPSEVWGGVALLAVGGAAYLSARRLRLLPAVLAVPGAWWASQVVALPGEDWVMWLLFAWIVIGAPLVASFDRHFANRGYGPVLLAISVAGMFATLPDTEEVLVVLGAAVLLPLLSWPRSMASLGAIGVYPLLGVLAWIIAIGGRGRGSAVIGAAACLGLLIVEPLIRWWRGRTLLDRLPNRWWWMPAAAGLQLMVVLLAARVAGLLTSVLASTVAALLILLASAAVLVVGTEPLSGSGIRTRRHTKR